MNYSKILQASTVFSKCAQQVADETIEDILHEAKLGSWAKDENGQLTGDQNAPFFVGYLNPALESLNYPKVDVTVGVNPDGSVYATGTPNLAGFPQKLLGTPTMKAWAQKVKAAVAQGIAAGRMPNPPKAAVMVTGYGYY